MSSFTRYAELKRSVSAESSVIATLVVADAVFELARAVGTLSSAVADGLTRIDKRLAPRIGT